MGKALTVSLKIYGLRFFILGDKNPSLNTLKIDVNESGNVLCFNEFYTVPILVQTLKSNTMSLVTIILNILLPPLAVFLKHGVGTTLLISIVLTLLAWLPGVIHAFIVNK